MYHNTTRVKGQQLELFCSQTKKQDAEILDIYNIVRTASPSRIWELLKFKYPLTSVRRAITNLTNSGKLIKTITYTKGVYGRPERVWKIAPKIH